MAEDNELQPEEQPQTDGQQPEPIEDQPVVSNGLPPIPELAPLDPDGVQFPDIGLIKPRVLETEIQESYLDYAMSVIVARALPDVRDGLKPVHRRILYSMHEMGLKSAGKHTKSAKIVGETMGKYHPHGDIAIYDTLARMAQPFSMRYRLVDGQGNFGSVDGDPPGAMRYTEARLSKISEEMLLDIDKETVPWLPNYDATLEEPQVLPAKVPNLLLNGALGIAVGMATNIPTHNLSEVVDGTIALIDNPDLTVDDLVEFVKGPDFPTGGLIYGQDDIKTAYATGKGPIVMRGQADIEETKNGFRIIISEIPYQVNKADLITRMAELVQEKKLEGISDIRDESDRNEGVRIVIELKSNAYPKKILNRLFELTALQGTFHVNMLALVDGLQPKILTLKEVLQHYIDHRVVVVTKRSEYELKKAREREHILEGLKKALDHIDEIIQLIKKSADRTEAHVNLVKKFELTDIQAEAILEMKLSQLAGLERKKIEDELAEKRKLITFLLDLLANPQKILGVIKDELTDVKARFGDDRRTKIIKGKIGEFTAEDLIPNEYVVVTITKGNYVKRVPVVIYRSQGRGGKGVVGMATKDEDVVEHVLTTWTHNDIMFFTDKGRVFTIKVYDLPTSSRQAKGQALVNFIQIAPDEKVTTMIAVESKKQDGVKYFFMATRKGVVKKTEIDQYRSIRKTGLIAIKLNSGDELGWVQTTAGHENVVMVTKSGAAIAFDESEVRPMGRSATGVRGINLRAGDEVMATNIVGGDKPDLMIVSENGLGKRTPLTNFREQHRGGFGIRAMNVTDKTGRLVEALVVAGDKGDVAIISQQGIVIRLPLKAVKRLGRATQGVRLMRVSGRDKVASVASVVIMQKEEQEEQEEEAAQPVQRGKSAIREVVKEVVRTGGEALVVSEGPVKVASKAGKTVEVKEVRGARPPRPKPKSEKAIKKAPPKTKNNAENIEQTKRAQSAYTVKFYKDEEGRLKRVIEKPGSENEPPKRAFELKNYKENEKNGKDRGRDEGGIEGNKNYWGADVWKKKK